MSVEYVQDDSRRRIRITLTEPLTRADVMGSVERQLAGGAWPFGVLVDARAAFVPLPPSDVQSIASSVLAMVATHGARGPIAVVARDSRVMGTVQRHALVTGPIESIEVFWDLDDAQKWLDERMS